MIAVFAIGALLGLGFMLGFTARKDHLTGKETILYVVLLVMSAFAVVYIASLEPPPFIHPQSAPTMPTMPSSPPQGVTHV